jgi:hypothetical protein
MRAWILAAASVVGLAGSGTAAPLSTADCAKAVAQVERTVAVLDLDLARLIRDGDGEVAAAARRLDAIRSEVPRSEGALVNAAQDLRYQLQVCARR